MDTIKSLLLLLLVINILITIVYTTYMSTKRTQYPKLDFSRFKDDKIDIDSIQKLVNKAITGVNGWMWLSALFMIIHYTINFWSITFMLTNLIIVIYELENSKSTIILLLASSLLLTFIDLWLNTKEKSIQYHNHWFRTSIITKDYIVYFASANSSNELFYLVNCFNNSIYAENKKVHFL